MLIKRQARKIVNQHIDILIKLKEDLSLIKHEGIKGEKPLKILWKSSRVYTLKVSPQSCTPMNEK